MMAPTWAIDEEIIPNGGEGMSGFKKLKLPHFLGCTVRGTLKTGAFRCRALPDL